MKRKSAVHVAGFACLIVASAAILGSFPQVQVSGKAYAAARKDYKNTLKLASEQRMLSQRMSKEVLLVALGYNKRENLRNLVANHNRFAQVLAGLRNGDPELALEGERNGKVDQSLRRVEELWPLFEVALRESVRRGKVTREGVGIVADLNLPLLQTMDDTIDAFEELAREGAVFTTLEVAVHRTEDLRMLSQKMAKEFLLVAYNHEPTRNREDLKATMARFEKVLGGLMRGDKELRLIPAPSAQLQAQFIAISRAYAETKPILLEAVAGESLNKDQLAEIARLSLILLDESGLAVQGYAAL